nr:hypothetical protein [Tanacetum cinerariifolium]
MFESSSYKLLPKHVALYEALEAYMEWENKDVFLAKKDNSCRQKSASHSKQPIEEAPTPDTEDIFDLEDIDSAHLLKIKSRPEWLKPILEEDILKTPEPDWSIPPNDLPEPKNNWANALANSFKDPKKLSKSDLEGPGFKVAKSFHKSNISLQFQMEECHRILTDHVNLVNPEDHWLVPDLSKPLPLGGPPGQLKAAHYLDFRLKELVSSLWNDISAVYGSVTASSSRSLSHLSGDDRVHLFNAINLWIRNIVIRKCVEDLQLGVKSYQTKLNLTQPDWDASDFLFKEYYTIVSKRRAIIYKDRNNHKKMMRETEVHKFSDGTLQSILENMHHMVKDFKLYVYNPGMETRIWFKDDRRRSKDLMEVDCIEEMNFVIPR